MSLIAEVAKRLTEVEKHTLTGQYKPDDKAAESIYTKLQDEGLVSGMGGATFLGQKVRSYLINERRKNLDIKTT